MRIDRVWAMPNRETFRIKPIAQLLEEEVTGGIWIDPFSGDNSPATFTNDLNPDTKAQCHVDALAFLKCFTTEFASGIFFDPPYSVRQLAECYKSVGIAVTQEMTRPNFWTDIKAEITRLVKPGGKVISCGWNSGGVGKTLGFSITRILLVPHGGIHNDTIITVEIKGA